MSRHGMPRRTARCAVYTGKPGRVQEAFFSGICEAKVRDGATPQGPACPVICGRACHL